MERPQVRRTPIDLRGRRMDPPLNEGEQLLDEHDDAIAYANREIAGYQADVWNKMLGGSVYGFVVGVGDLVGDVIDGKWPLIWTQVDVTPTAHRPGRPGDPLCTCGRIAAEVYLTDTVGDIGFCGLPHRMFEEADDGPYVRIGEQPRRRRRGFNDSLSRLLGSGR